MKILNLSNSHFNEITSDEAANVNGGSGYSYVSYSKLYDDYFGFSYTGSDYSSKSKPQIDTSVRSYPGFKDYYKTYVAAIDSPKSISVSYSTDTAFSYP
ncbi:MAG: hypothetical protein AAF383_21885 [Cyanobacteria bacterium P01_A01_bin.83]